MARNTICGWIMAAAEVCMPMRDVLMGVIRASGYVQADETPVQYHLKKQLNHAIRRSPNA